MADSLRWYYKRMYEGVNYRLRTFAGGRFTNHCRPTSITVLLTELCTAKCVHCDIWKNRYKEDSPTPDQWKQVITDLRQWLGPVQVTFSGGEALMKPFTTDLVAHASSQGLFLEILTHGYWEDQGKIERLAAANPWRVTISLDAIGELHTTLRGRPKFWERTSNSLNTLTRVRKEKGLDYTIRLKTVIMAQNMAEVANVTHYAAEHGMESFYQPIEQNYNTPEDPLWYEKSENWPRDTEKAIAAVQGLIDLKKKGMPIANSLDQLEAMIPYYKNPAAMRLAVQSHVAHERRAICAATTTLQLQANGDVTTCYGQKPVGNIKQAPIRAIWESRPQWWNTGCCLERRCSVEEKEHLSLPVLQ